MTLVQTLRRSPGQPIEAKATEEGEDWSQLGPQASRLRRRRRRLLLDLAAFRREAAGILDLPVDVATADMLKERIRDETLGEALPL